MSAACLCCCCCCAVGVSIEGGGVLSRRRRCTHFLPFCLLFVALSTVFLYGGLSPHLVDAEPSTKPATQLLQAGSNYLPHLAVSDMRNICWVVPVEGVDALSCPRCRQPWRAAFCSQSDQVRSSFLGLL